jgi:hypothetical protein
VISKLIILFLIWAILRASLVFGFLHLWQVASESMVCTHGCCLLVKSRVVQLMVNGLTRKWYRVQCYSWCSYNYRLYMKRRVVQHLINGQTSGIRVDGLIRDECWPVVDTLMVIASMWKEELFNSRLVTK